MRKYLFMAALLLAAAGAQAQSSASDLLGKLGQAVSSLTAKTGFDLKDLKGTWEYVSPEVTFESDNALNKLGGAVANGAVTEKLEPYYKQLGLDKMTITFDDEQNFQMTVRGRTLKGSVSREEGAEDGYITFDFQVFGKKKLGGLKAHATMSATKELTLTFDASKFVTIMKVAASITKNSSLQSLTKLLESYDGIYIGARMKRTDAKKK